MPELVLSERQQRALRDLMAMTPVPGELPGRDVLETLDRLIPSDIVGVALADETGRVERESSAPIMPPIDPHVCDGPLYVGVVHVSRQQGEAELLARDHLKDAVWVGFRNGPRHVVQLSPVRSSRMYDERDLALVAMVEPWLQRLLRIGPTPRLPSTLTVSERRVLMQVAVGLSNAEIAATLFIAPSTVRKHLENAYRKLGVRSRLAAVTVMRDGSVDRELARAVAGAD